MHTTVAGRRGRRFGGLPKALVPAEPPAGVRALGRELPAPGVGLPDLPEGPARRGALRRAPLAPLLRGRAGRTRRGRRVLRGRRPRGAAQAAARRAGHLRLRVDDAHGDEGGRWVGGEPRIHAFWVDSSKDRSIPLWIVPVSTQF